ncbi:MAG: aminotransferase class V-fold PLP-dependent enzyme [bacterium]|nr:aminotransferase class V-fold PLP-dependent enzyme [bacterium]
MFRRRTYLDFAAGVEGNPSSPHEEGRRAKQMLEDARISIARLIEVKPDDIIFTSGATEANNLAIQGMKGFVNPSFDEGFTKPVHALYLPSAHASVVETMRAVGKRGVEVEPLPIRDGRVDCDALAKMIRPETALVSMDAVCGETGTVWNTREVTHTVQSFFCSLEALQPLAKNLTVPRAFIHVDASQAPFTEKISRAHFSADLLTLDGGKLGVRGIGCLVANRTIPLSPIMYGGGQERGLRSGTENPEAAAKFAAALRAAASGRDTFRLRAVSMRAELTRSISERIPNLYINEGAETAPHILNISLPRSLPAGRQGDTDYLVAVLDEAGFAVSTRSACETDSREGSRAVYALTRDRARALSTLRISWGPSTRESNLRRFADELTRAVAFIDNAGRKSHY